MTLFKYGGEPHDHRATQSHRHSPAPQPKPHQKHQEVHPQNPALEISHEISHDRAWASRAPIQGIRKSISREVL